MATTSSPSLQGQLDDISVKVATMIKGVLTPKEVDMYEAQFVPRDLLTDSPYPPARVGDKATDFSLSDSTGQQVSLSGLVKSGRHVILVWYRGEWCPFCQATLKTHNEHVEQYRALNAELLALTPTLPAYTATTVADYGLKFKVLTDAGNQTSKAYGTLNQLNEDLSKVHIKLGVDFEKIYGNSTHQLPHPGTVVVEANTGRIVFSQIDHDYRKRAEPEQIIEVLKRLARN